MGGILQWLKESWWLFAERVRVWRQKRKAHPHVWSWWEEVERPATEMWSETLSAEGKKRAQVRRCARCGLIEELSLRPSSYEPVGCTSTEERG